jgi:Acetyltransferase (GNAT) domain
MTDVKVVRYSGAHRNSWDDFVGNSKNGSFLFQRDYVEYHEDRFPDNSLMFYDEREQLIALLPATVSDGVLSSHAGLTFGGVVSDSKMRVGLMLDVFTALISDLRTHQIFRLIYKAVPHIYHRLPAEEDLYALFRNGARLIRRDVSTTIDMNVRLPFSEIRKRAIKRGQKHGLRVKRSFDFEAFMTIAAQVLETKYDARPVHSVAEIEMLAGRFPENIKLFAAHRDKEMLAGVIIYESSQVAHTQYIGATDEGKRTGALDSIISYCLDDY